MEGGGTPKSRAQDPPSLPNLIHWLKVIRLGLRNASSLPPDAEIAFEIHSPGATFSGATCRIRGLKLTQYLFSWTRGKGDVKARGEVG